MHIQWSLLLTVLILGSWSLSGCSSSESPPESLYKVVSVSEWEQSLREQRVVLSPMDKEFIHLASREQLEHVTDKFWKDRRFVILRLKSNQLQGQLRLEVNPGGTNQYYHLYDGEIPYSAVDAVYTSLAQVK